MKYFTWQCYCFHTKHISPNTTDSIKSSHGTQHEALIAELYHDKSSQIMLKKHGIHIITIIY